MAAPVEWVVPWPHLTGKEEQTEPNVERGENVSSKACFDPRLTVKGQPVFVEGPEGRFWYGGPQGR